MSLRLGVLKYCRIDGTSGIMLRPILKQPGRCSSCVDEYTHNVLRFTPTRNLQTIPLQFRPKHLGLPRLFPLPSHHDMHQRGDDFLLWCGSQQQNTKTQCRSKTYQVRSTLYSSDRWHFFSPLPPCLPASLPLCCPLCLSLDPGGTEPCRLRLRLLSRKTSFWKL